MSRVSQNEHICLIALYFVIHCLVFNVSTAHLSAKTPNRKDLDICSHWNGRRHFLEMGERGDLHAQNVSSAAYRSTIYTPLSARNRTSADIWYQCNLELVTCAECVIRVTFTFSNFSKTCDRPLTANINNPKLFSKCPCELIQFSEPPYDNAISGHEFCGDGKVFRSKTRTLLLKFMYRASNSHVFSLQYFSERNVQITSGSPRQSIVNNNSQNEPLIISTPYFPMAYPRDYAVEHILTCEAENCMVRLDFTDFQLGLTSTMEIFDSNGQMLDSYTGENFRPPIIVSSGKSLLLQFRGNGVNGAGYRAEVLFVTSKQIKERQLVPFTDCGGMVSGPGGAITMMNMIENATEVRLYDCIWVIKPANNYMMMKTHISLRVDAFNGLASPSELTVHQGTTSNAIQVEAITWPNNGMSMKNHIAPIMSGYYIRLRGVFGMSSKLAIVYSVFNYLNCYIGSEFLCNNNHCISIRLHCDGFDHCGDGSDEPETCEEEWANIQSDRRWYSNKPNYYFPKIEQYPDLRTATGIFAMSTLGILAVLSGWMIILYRMGIRARHQRELQSHLQTISEFLDRQEEMTDEPPPDYEAPPDYEEVIKVGMENAIDSSKRDRNRRRHHRHDRSRSTSRANGPATSQPPGSSQQYPLYDPSASTDVASESDSAVMQELTSRVIAATTHCEATGPSTAATIERGAEASHSALGIESCGSSVSLRSELPDSNTHQRFQGKQNSICSGGTTTQYEECSAEFRDEPLNISLSLALPTTSELRLPRPKSNICNENTYLKNSWVVFNSGQHNCRVQRLRHTFSSPESFLPDFFEPNNYGTTNPSERNSLMSNPSVFGSELSRDNSSLCAGTPKTGSSSEELLQNLRNAEITPEYESSSERRPLKSKFPPTNSSPDCFQFDNQNNVRCQHLPSHSEPTSCFGSVNLFRPSNSKRRSNQSRQHTRSKSFTHLETRHQRSSRLPRSSSFDYLIRVPLVKTSDGTSISRIYII